jgi:uncharacterized membrane protein
VGATFLAAVTLTVSYSTAIWHGLASHGDTCVIHRLTGWQCPLCGMTHAVVALLHGNIATALHRNPLAPLYVAGLAWAVVVAWSPPARTWARTMSSRLPPSTAGLFALGVVAFGIGRNLV